MSVRITTYMDGPAPALDRLPEARAVCDGCGAAGPPVECRPQAWRREHDDRALMLAVAVASFERVLARPAKGKAHSVHLCARCVRERAS
jgi:hypothetical protein